MGHLFVVTLIEKHDYLRETIAGTLSRLKSVGAVIQIVDFENISRLKFETSPDLILLSCMENKNPPVDEIKNMFPSSRVIFYTENHEKNINKYFMNTGVDQIFEIKSIARDVAAYIQDMECTNDVNP